jgi:hypothetical protein
MSKIATKGICNIIEADNMNSGAFLSDLIACPTYGEIIEIGKLNVSGTYEYNQLVKESDITKYTGKTKNYSYIWGEWDLTRKNGQNSLTKTYLNLKLRQNFLHAPDTNLKITIIINLTYINSDSFYITGMTKTLTTNFTQTTSDDKKYAYTQEFAIMFGNSTSSRVASVIISEVTVEPLVGTSKYEYVTNIKDITQNYFVTLFSNSITDFYVDTYNDNTTSKTITNKCRISPKFDIPTGTDINNIDIYITEKNFSGNSTVSVIYNPTYNFVEYTFNAIDYYGKRGYKLPYFYTKFVLEQRNTTYKSYVYALWNPSTTNSGIELTSLILDE